MFAMFKKSFFLLMMASCMLEACSTAKEKTESAAAAKAEMMAAENTFSAMTEQKGIRNALMQYIDSNGVLLRPGTLPLSGADAIDFISQATDSAYSMVWQPKGGSVAASGDMGYTYGIYKISPKSKGDTLYGTYVNIWKKHPDGTWRLALDSGNEGVE